MPKKPRCPRHPDQILVCLKCYASKGGKTTARKHAGQLREWGKLGGRPRKPVPAETEQKAQPDNLTELGGLVAREPADAKQPSPEATSDYQPLTIDEIRDFIARSRWQFAKSMPQMPHYYTLRAESPDEQTFVRFVLHIRKHGYRRKFGRTTYTYLDLDGWAYWTMGCPVGEVGRYNPNTDTILINRAELNPAPNPQRRLAIGTGGRSEPTPQR